MDRFENQEIRILYYADDAVLLAETAIAKQLPQCTTRWNIVISKSLIKRVTISKEPLRRKLVVENEAIQQIINFYDLGTKITIFGGLQNRAK